MEQTESKAQYKISNNSFHDTLQKRAVKLKLNFFSKNSDFAVPFWTGR
jgi:hypothetical protein